MADKVGVENLKKLVMLGAEALNVGSKIIHGGGVFSLFSLVDEVNSLSTLDKDVLLAEVKDLSVEERKQLEDSFKEKLSLENKSNEIKIEGSVDLVEKGITLGLRAVAMVSEGKALVEEVKVLLSKP